MNDFYPILLESIDKLSPLMVFIISFAIIIYYIIRLFKEKKPEEYVLEVVKEQNKTWLELLDPINEMNQEFKRFNTTVISTLNRVEHKINNKN